MKAFKLINLAVVLTSVTLTSGCIAVARAAVGDRTPDMGKIFDSADTNGDGIITRAEFMAAREKLFIRLDRNGDGFIDKDDVPSRPMARGKAQEKLAALVTQLDKDGDGRISKSEFVDGPTPMFDLADTDHNGELSHAEVEAAKQKLKELAAERKGG